jgi:uncharacterized membrane protein YvbJ
MRKLFQALCLAVVFMILSLNVLNAEASEPGEVVTAYFQALKNGDTETVKNLITGKLYDKRIDLLEKNAGYSVFLKKFYQGVSVRVVNTVKETEEAYVDVEIESQDGSQNPMTLTLKKDGDANWKISDEIENP